MRDTELYRAILGLTPPWTVGSVELGLPAGQVIVRVDAGAGPFACPECGRAAERYDRRPRRWRPFDTWQLTTWIEAPGPRIDCAPHGVKQIRVPWAEPGSPFRGLFERLPIDLPGECSVTGATRVLRISWDEAWASRPAPSAGGWPRRQGGVVPHLGVDEKAIAKRHRYLTGGRRSCAPPGALSRRRPQAGACRP